MIIVVVIFRVFIIFLFDNEAKISPIIIQNKTLVNNNPKKLFICSNIFTIIFGKGLRYLEYYDIDQLFGTSLKLSK